MTGRLASTRIRTVLTAMVAIPLLGLTASLGGRIATLQRQQHRAQRVVKEANRLQLFVELDLALRADATAGFVAVGARQANISLPLLESMLHIPVRARGFEARRTTDDLLRQLGTTSLVLGADVSAARAALDDPRNNEMVDTAYRLPLHRSEAQLDRQLAVLRTLATGTLRGDAVLRAADASELSVRAYQRSSYQAVLVTREAVGGAFASRDRVDLATDTRELDRMNRRLESGELGALAKVISESPQHRELRDRAFRLATSPRAPKASISDRLSTFSAIAKKVEWRSTKYLELTNAANTLMQRHARIAATHAADAMRWMSILLATALALTLAAAFALGRSITIAIQRFERHALRLVDGVGPFESLPERGPREIVVAARAFNRLAHAASHDPLTGLLNRTAVEQQLERLRTEGSPSAVLFVDLDAFKAINDEHGHLVGDLVLQEVADILLRCVRTADQICRFGGDEFIVVCPGLTSSEEARVLAQRIVEMISKPMLIGSETLHVGASVGVALAMSSETPTDLLARADTETYRAKARGRGTVSLAASHS